MLSLGSFNSLTFSNRSLAFLVSFILFSVIINSDVSATVIQGLSLTHLQPNSSLIKMFHLELIFLIASDSL